MAGTEFSNNKNLVVKYWKNGIPTLLTDEKSSSSVAAIKVVGNDVYVAGIELNGSINIAKYWKNGIAIPLTNGTINSGVNGMFITTN